MPDARSYATSLLLSVHLGQDKKSYPCKPAAPFEPLLHSSGNTEITSLPCHPCCFRAATKLPPTAVLAFSRATVKLIEVMTHPSTSDLTMIFLMISINTDLIL
jgi:hypothetical protein